MTGPSSRVPALRAGAAIAAGGGADQGVSPMAVLEAIRQWWKVATPLGLVLAAAGVALVYVVHVPQYKAEAWLRIEGVTPFVAFPSDENASNSQSFVRTQIGLMRSPLVLGPVLDAPIEVYNEATHQWEPRPEKRQVYNQTNRQQEWVEVQPKIATLPAIRKQEDPVEWLAKEIQIRQVENSELFTISFESPDPNTAALVANAVADQYLKLRGEEDAQQHQRIVGLLQDERDKRLNEVRLLRENLRELSKQATGKDPFAANPIAETSETHPLLADLLSRLVSVEVGQEVLRAEIQALEEDIGQPARVPDWAVQRAVEGYQEIQRLKADLTAKRAGLTQIKSISMQGEKAAAYVQLAEEISRDEATLEEVRVDVENRVRAELEAVVVSDRQDGLAQKKALMERYAIEEKLLRSRYESELADVQTSRGDTLQLAFTQAELERAEKVFDLIAQRVLQLQVERGAFDRVRLMRRATTPTVPVETVPYLRMGAALAAGLCLPFVLAIGWERVVRRIRDRQHLEQQANLVVVGEIACLPARPSGSRGSLSRRVSEDLQVFEESIDSLRTSLVLSDEFKEVRVLAVTSAVNHEGKTSVAAQLAVSIARASGEPTLLIDGDMRSPGVHRVFEIPLEPGLAEVLGGRCPLESAIVTTWSDTVHLLPGGRLHASPHQLLGNGAVHSLLRKVSASYRYVILDTPPVLAAGETLILAKAADASLVCAMRDVSRTDQVTRAYERLAAVGVRLIGTVLNGVPTKRYTYRYGSYGYSRE